MIFMIGGIPTSGKSTLMRSIIEELGSLEDCEPMPLFRCQSHGDILVVGRYPKGETFGGTDKISYGAIPKFRDFIRQEESKWKNILIEGDRFVREKDISWILANYTDSRIYILKVPLEVEKQRHIDRGDSQSEQWLSTRRGLIRNLETNMMLMGDLLIRNTTVDNVKQEILKELLYTEVT